MIGGPPVYSIYLPKWLYGIVINNSISPTIV